MKRFLFLAFFTLLFYTSIAGDLIEKELKRNLNVYCDSSTDSTSDLNYQKLFVEFLILSEEFYRIIYQQCHDTYYSAAGHEVYRYRFKMDECFSSTLTYFADSFDLFCLNEYSNELRSIVKKCGSVKNSMKTGK